MFSDFFQSITNNGYEVLVALALANVVAQFLKPFTIAWKKKKLDFLNKTKTIKKLRSFTYFKDKPVLFYSGK